MKILQVADRPGWAIDYCEHGKNIVFLEEDEVKNTKMLSGIIDSTYKAQEFREELRKNALELIKDFSLEKYCENVMNLYQDLSKK